MMASGSNILLPVAPIPQSDLPTQNVLFKYGFSENHDCTTSCLRIILKYYGRDVTWEEIDRFVLRDSNGASFNSEMARFAKSKGFSATIFGYNLYFTDPSDANLSQKQLLMKLEKASKQIEDDWYKEALKTLIISLKNGVKYKVRKPSLQLIASWLRRGVPLITQVNTAALYDRQGDPFVGHDIVLSGFKGNRFYFIDPNSDKEESVTGSNLLFAIASRRAIATADYLTAIWPS